MAIRKLENGNYEATIYLGERNGKKKRLYKNFLTKKDAKLWESQKKIEKIKGVLQIDLTESATFYSVAQRYLKDEAPNRSPNTILNYKAQLDKHILPEIGMLQMHTISPRIIQDFKVKLIEDGVLSKHINYVLRVTKTIFKYAISGLLQLNIKDPTTPIRPIRIQGHTQEKKYLSKKELNELIDALEDNHYKDFIIFLLNHGLRISEAAALQVSKYDSKNKRILINQQFHPYLPREKEKSIRGAFTLGALKNCSTRHIYLNETTDKIIRTLCLSKELDHFIFEPMRKRECDLRSIVLKRGTKAKIIKCHVINSRSDGFNREVFQKIIASSKIDGRYSVHNLRDTFATHFLSETKDMRALQKLLGHKSIISTQVYADILDETSKGYASAFEIKVK